MKNYCPKCGQPFEQDVKFCVHCGYEPKSKTLAGILQCFALPGLALGRFYLGDYKLAIGQLASNLIPGVATIWCIIDGIMLLLGIAKSNPAGAKVINTVTKVVNDPGVRRAAGNLRNSVSEFGDSFDTKYHNPDEVYVGDFYGDGFGKHEEPLDRERTYKDLYGNELYWDGYDWRKRNK